MGVLVYADHPLEVGPQGLKPDQRVPDLVRVVGELGTPEGVAYQHTLLLGLGGEEGVWEEGARVT